MITNLKVVNHDSEGDVVSMEVPLHRGQTAARHSDVDGKLSGDWVEPEVQLGSDEQRELTDRTHNNKIMKDFSMSYPQIDQET